MAAPATLLNSSVGRKIVMAITGIVLSLFILGHMVGNLQAFLPNGPQALDHYGAFLRELLHGTGIWFVRGALLLAVGLHVWAYLGLTLKSWAARPKGYSVNDFEEATFASGLASVPVALFYILAMGCLAFHLWHGAWSMLQTLGLSHPKYLKARKAFAIVFTVLVTGGFVLVPLAVLAGMLK